MTTEKIPVDAMPEEAKLPVLPWEQWKLQRYLELEFGTGLKLPLCRYAFANDGVRIVGTLK